MITNTNLNVNRSLLVNNSPKYHYMKVKIFHSVLNIFRSIFNVHIHNNYSDFKKEMLKNLTGDQIPRKSSHQACKEAQNNFIHVLFLNFRKKKYVF